jgi:hypothetical protein
MPRVVDAHCRDGTVITYRISLRPATLRYTDDEYIGIAKQYHVEDGLQLDTVERWVLHPPGAAATTSHDRRRK